MGKHRLFRTAAAAVTAAAALCLASTALANSAQVSLVGGTPAEQSQVRNALAASTFNWSLLPRAITVHLTPLPGGSYSLEGEVWIDSKLLDKGKSSWGTVQHEFGHQVDFFLLSDADRAKLEVALGGQNWCDETPSLPHSAFGCERFASELSWAYWQTSENWMQPTYIGNESGHMPTPAFRSLLASLLDGPSTVAATAVAAAPKVLTSRSVRGTLPVRYARPR